MHVATRDQYESDRTSQMWGQYESDQHTRDG